MTKPALGFDVTMDSSGMARAIVELTGMTERGAAKITAVIARLSSAYEAQTKALQNAGRVGAQAFDDQAAASKRFMDTLRDQVATQGKSTTELLRYRAAQLGVSDAAASYINKIEAAAAAQQAAAQAAKTEAAAQREAAAAKASAKASTESFLASLREQIALMGKSDTDVLRMRAGQAGAGFRAMPLIAQYDAAKQAMAAAEAESRAKQATDAFIASLTRRTELLGKDEFATLRWQAAQVNATAAAEPLIAKLEAEAQAHRAAAAAEERHANITAAMNNIRRAAYQQEQAAFDLQKAQIAKEEAFIAQVKERAATQGMSGADLLRRQAAQLGVGPQVESAIQQIAAFEAANRRAVSAQNASAQASRDDRVQKNLVAQAYRLLPMQITDVVTSLSTGMPVWMVAIQQGGQIKDSLTGIHNPLRVLLGFLNPLKLAMGAGAAAAGLLAYEMYQGRAASEKLAVSLKLTSNAAGLTVDGFRALAGGSAAATRSTVGDSREMLQALVSTGKLGGENLALAQRAALLYAKATGDTADEVAKDMASMSDGVHKWAMEHNRSMHFMSAAELERVRAMEEAGQATAAAGLVLERYNKHLEGTKIEVGYLVQAYRDLVEWTSKATTKLRDWGAPNTMGQTLERESARLAAMKKDLAELEASGREWLRSKSPNFNVGDKAGMQAAVREQEELVAHLRATMATSEFVAAGLSDSARRQQEGAAASDVVRQITNEVDQRSKATKEVERYTTAVRKMREAGMPTAPTEKQEAATVAEIRKKYGPKPEHAYSDMLIDIEKYNALSDQMAGTTMKVAEYDQWAADMRARLAKETDKMTAAEHRSIEAKIVAAAASRHDAEQIKKATEMEAEMQNLLAQRGLVGPGKNRDEEMRTAATKYLQGIADETKNAEALVNGSFQRMEDAVINFARTGKLSFSDLFGFMAEEYLRQVTRMAMKSMFTDSAGNFLGIGGIFSAASNFLGFGSHANGLDYVPRDGYLAMLHKGERVQTAMEANATRQGAANDAGFVLDMSGQTNIIGQGVGRAEVVAGLSQAHDRAVATITRRLRRAGIAV